MNKIEYDFFIIKIPRRMIHEYILKYRFEVFRLTLSLIFLTFGGLIYLGFRSTDLLLYKFLERVGFNQILQEFRVACSNIYLPEWIIYSLPDGLWLSAYFFVINSIWQSHRSFLYRFFIFTIPFLAILLELAQYFNLCPGTFDKIDLICYIIPLLILTPLKYEF